MYMNKGILLLIIFIILPLNLVYASYYADIDIDVYNDGTVRITGESNHSLLQSGIYDDLIVKKKGYWLLNITTKEKFSEYKYTLNLPKNIKINYLGLYKVDTFDDTDGFTVSGVVKNRPFAMVIQYKSSLFKSNLLYLVVLVVLILILGIIAYFLVKKKKSRKKYIKEQFSEREYMIIKLLQKNKNCLTQAELERITKLPKASLHRNIFSLENKGIIEKNKAGMSNKIHLKQ